jgi:hypothetical protein
LQLLSQRYQRLRSRIARSASLCVRLRKSAAPIAQRQHTGAREGVGAARIDGDRTSEIAARRGVTLQIVRLKARGNQKLR